jgi:hypothetical protein
MMFSDYCTLGELDGFIESQQCDYTLIAGDFNVDFDRGGRLASLFLFQNRILLFVILLIVSRLISPVREMTVLCTLVLTMLCVHSHSLPLLLIYIL